MLHREDGPAVERISGTKVWCLLGQIHREDCPVVINFDGIYESADETKEWWLNGKKLTETEFEKLTIYKWQ